MPEITFASSIRRHVACHTLQVNGATVAEALEEAFSVFPQVKSYLLDDQSHTRQHIVMYVNDRPVKDRLTLSDKLVPRDTLHVFQALSGG
jgi:sulfur-carrier protein